MRGGESIVTEADTLPELRDMVRDAVCCHFDRSEGPRAIRLHMVRQELMSARDYPAISPAANWRVLWSEWTAVFAIRPAATCGLLSWTGRA